MARNVVGELGALASRAASVKTPPQDAASVKTPPLDSLLSKAARVVFALRPNVESLYELAYFVFAWVMIDLGVEGFVASAFAIAVVAGIYAAIQGLKWALRHKTAAALLVTCVAILSSGYVPEGALGLASSLYDDSTRTLQLDPEDLPEFGWNDSVTLDAEESASENAEGAEGSEAHSAMLRDFPLESRGVLLAALGRAEEFGEGHVLYEGRQRELEAASATNAVSAAQEDSDVFTIGDDTHTFEFASTRLLSSKGTSFSFQVPAHALFRELRRLWGARTVLVRGEKVARYEEPRNMAEFLGRHTEPESINGQYLHQFYKQLGAAVFSWAFAIGEVAKDLGVKTNPNGVIKYGESTIDVARIIVLGANPVPVELARRLDAGTGFLRTYANHDDERSVREAFAGVEEQKEALSAIASLAALDYALNQNLLQGDSEDDKKYVTARFSLGALINTLFGLPDPFGWVMVRGDARDLMVEAYKLQRAHEAMLRDLNVRSAARMVSGAGDFGANDMPLDVWEKLGTLVYDTKQGIASIQDVNVIGERRVRAKYEKAVRVVSKFPTLRALANETDPMGHSYMKMISAMRSDASAVLADAAAKARDIEVTAAQRLLPDIKAVPRAKQTRTAMYTRLTEFLGKNATGPAFGSKRFV